MKKQEKIKWVFDLDDTIIYTDHDKLKKQEYLIVKPDRTMPLFDFFRSLRQQKADVAIVTNRPPEAREKIAKYLRLPVDRVHCRTFNLSAEDKRKMKENPALKDEFHQRIARDKSATLNALSSEVTALVFFDDKAQNFRKQPLHDNIFVYPPMIPKKKLVRLKKELSQI